MYAKMYAPCLVRVCVSPFGNGRTNEEAGRYTDDMTMRIHIKHTTLVDPIAIMIPEYAHLDTLRRMCASEVGIEGDFDLLLDNACRTKITSLDKLRDEDVLVVRFKRAREADETPVPIMGTFTDDEGTEYNPAERSSHLTWDESKCEYGENMAKKVLRAVPPPDAPPSDDPVGSHASTLGHLLSRDPFSFAYDGMALGGVQQEVRRDTVYHYRRGKPHYTTICHLFGQSRCCHPDGLLFVRTTDDAGNALDAQGLTKSAGDALKNHDQNWHGAVKPGRKTKGKATLVARLPSLRDLGPQTEIARTAPGGAAEGMIESEAESVAGDQFDDVDDAPLELWPWQESAIDIIKGTTSNRTIHWFHSTEGNVGKTHGVGAFLCRYEGAVLLAPDEFKGAKHLIAKKMEATHGKFREWPIVIIDLPRANTELVRSSKLYVLIEEVQNLFSASDRRFIIPPTVVVFANEPPATEMMSPDRFQVQQMGSAPDGKLYLRKDYATHKALKEFAQTLRAREPIFNWE